MDTADIKIITDLNSELKKDFRLALAAQSTHISARLDLKVETKLSGVDKKVDRLLNHNEKQNGWIEKHNERLDAIDGEEGTIEKLSWMTKLGKNWRVVIGGIVITFFALHSLFEYVNIKTIIQFAIKIFT